MNFVDYTLVGIYLAAMLWLGRQFKKNRLNTDYFLGGRRFGSFPLAMSAMATQLGAVSFISAPAFVGLRSGGGMQWLTYEFGVPLAMVGIMLFVAPALYKSGVVSAYAFVEQRLGRGAGQTLSVLFMANAVFSAAITINMVCVVLGTITGVPFWGMMTLLAVVTVAYSLEGGMKAIVYSEVAQMIIKALGIALLITLGLHLIGGWSQFTEHVSRDRLRVVNFHSVGFDGGQFGFWPMSLGGMFLYLSYYGTDQTQAQRLLSARDEKTVRGILLLNGLLRFPVTCAYCLGGLVIGTFLARDPSFASQVPIGKPDLMIPVFIMRFVPHGVVGLLVIALLAAGMSSFSSYINSLSAVTMENFVTGHAKIGKDRYVFLSRAVTTAWGAVTIAVVTVASKVAPTAIEAINMVSSVFFGPIVGMFILATSRKRIPAGAANIGAVVGVLVNVALWVFCKNVFWMWWNLIGAVVTMGTAYLLSPATPAPAPQLVSSSATSRGRVPVSAWVLVGYFILMVCVAIAIPRFL
jgi:SSS family transporter